MQLEVDKLGDKDKFEDVVISASSSSSSGFLMSESVLDLFRPLKTPSQTFGHFFSVSRAVSFGTNAGDKTLIFELSEVGVGWFLGKKGAALTLKCRVYFCSSLTSNLPD